MHTAVNVLRTWITKDNDDSEKMPFIMNLDYEMMEHSSDDYVHMDIIAIRS